MAVLAAIAIFFTANYVTWAQNTADKHTYTILTAALDRYKTEGGGVKGLTQNATIGRVIAQLQTPRTWAGFSHQFLSSAVTYSGRSIGETGSGAQYHFSQFGSYNDKSGDGSGRTGGGVVAPINVIVNGGFETGDFASWSSSDADGDCEVYNSSVPPYPHAGSCFCEVAASPGGDYTTDWIQQTITVPPASHLGFWVITGAFLNGTSMNVTFKGTQIYSTTTTMAAWTYISVDMSTYAGQTGNLRISANGSYSSTAVISLDDITLQ